MAHAGLLELEDRLDHVLWRPQRAVALRGLAEIHGVALAERHRRGIEGLLVGVVDAREEQVGGAEAAVEGAGRLAGGRCDLFQSLAVHVGRDDVGHPAVGHASDAPQRRIGAAAAPDRRPAGLPRRRLHLHALEIEELAGMGDRLAGPQLAHDREAFAQPRAAFVERHAAGLVLLGKLATHADAEDEAPFRQMVERRDLLGDRGRMAQGQQVDVRAEHQAPAQHGGLRELHQRVEDRDGEGDVIAHPHRIVAAAVDQADQVRQFVDGGQPRPLSGLRAPVEGLHADAEVVVQGQVHGA